MIYCSAQTGLADSIAQSVKYRTLADGTRTTKFSKPADINDTNGDELYCPEECKVGFTVFAESDEVLKANGINSFDDLVAYANKEYGGAAAWYDYINEKGLSVSTGNDYTNRFNALNMFVAYHILYASMAQDQLVFENKSGVPVGTSKWNYVNGADPYDYYQTMLPNTLMKIWEPQPGKTLYINRYQTFNTLTNEVGTRGTNHVLKFAGVEIERQDITAYNGYIHPIKDMLVYNEQVPKGVLNERLRFEATTFLPEFINNGFRYMSINEVSALNGGGSGARLAFPVDYFDNVICYNGEQTVYYNIYNKKGETVLSEETSRPLKINMINDSIVDIGIGMGTGITVHKYYDANQDLFSQEYTYVVANRNELIAYIAIPEKNPMENRKIVVQNVFDKNLFCKEFPMDFSKVDTPVVKAEFSEDGKSLQITYLSGEEKTEITETLNLFD